MSGVLVHDGGFLTTVQDLGRWGWQAFGVPVAGPMDRRAHVAANDLAGNRPGAALLEVTLAGPTLVCERATRIAVTGAPWSLQIGGTPGRTPLVADVPAGETVAFVKREAGARAYVAFAGGIDVPIVLGSRSTDLRSRFGGYHGRALRAGDRLDLGDDAAPGAPAPARPLLDAGVWDAPRRLRVLAGPAGDEWTRAALDQLTAREWTVSTRSDRMGYRLQGEALSGGTGLMISAPTVVGAVQVPPGGQPILLMADRQTTGGYPVAAVVITADLPVAGQLLPDDRLRFVEVTLPEALASAWQPPRGEP